MSLEQQKNKHESSWRIGYNHLVEVINSHNLKRGAEIGVAFGGHSEAILKNTKIEKLYGIDPYKHSDDYVDAMNLEQKEFDELFQKTIRRLEPFGKRYNHIRKYSEGAARYIPEQLDFVYIDGDHSYDGVWIDLCAWFGKIKDGGIISGHDYMNPYFPGVQEAIDKFFGRFNWKVNYEGDMMWWVEKRPIHTSFFMPAFNSENTIAESIRSILDTNFRGGDELIVVDDGSTDNTLNVLKQFPEVKVVNHTRNKGGAAARNTAIEHTTNEILFCLDSDNVLAQHSIAPLKKLLVEKGADCAAFQKTCYFENDINKVYKTLVYPFEEVTLEKTLGNNSSSPVGMGNYMFTKESWRKAGGYPDGNWLDTWGFGIRQLFNGTKMFVLPGSFYFHRRGHESYYVRGAKQGRVSLTALTLLIPYLEFLSKGSIRYIMGRGKYTWFENLDKKPLKLSKSKLELKDAKTKLKEFIKKRFSFAYKTYTKLRYGK